MEKMVIEYLFSYFQSLAITLLLLIALWGLVKLDQKRDKNERERIMKEVEETVKID